MTAAERKRRQAAERKRRQGRDRMRALRASRRAAGVCTACGGPLSADGGGGRCAACFWGGLEDSPKRKRVKNRKDWNCAVCGVVLVRGETTWRVTCYGGFTGVAWAKKHAVCDTCYGSISFRKQNEEAESEMIVPETADHLGGRPKNRPKKRGKERRRARRLQRRGSA